MRGLESQGQGHLRRAHLDGLLERLVAVAGDSQPEGAAGQGSEDELAAVVRAGGDAQALHFDGSSPEQLGA